MLRKNDTVLKATIENFLQKIENPLRKVNTEMIRQYLSDYQAKNECSKVTVDNVRRNLSVFSHGWRKKTIF